MPRPEPAPLAIESAEYRIGANDALGVTVHGHPELSGIVHVRPDGYVGLPLIYDLRAAERTPDELTAEIERRLSAYVIEPKVTVVVLESLSSTGQQVRIIGDAAAPRAVPFRKGMTALDALTEVSGLSPYANGNAAVLVRGDPLAPSRIPLRLDDLIERGDVSKDVPLEPGDVIIIPRGFFAGDWQTKTAVTLSTTYTDNYGLDPDGQRDPALITAVIPSLNLSGRGGRITGALSAAVGGAYRSLSDEGPELLVDVLGTSTAELARDSVFLDASASISQEQLSTTGARSGAGSNNNDLTLVQSYALSPYFLARVKDVADVEGRYIFGATLTGDSGGERDRNFDSSRLLSDSVTNGAVITLRSPGDVAPHVQLQQTTYGLYTTRFDTSDVTVAGAALTPSYSVAPGLALLATGGYDVLDDGDEHLSGPNVAAGLRYKPNPAFSLYASGGWRLEHPQADVQLRYDVTSRTTLGLSYSDGVSVGQMMLLQNLTNLAYDPVSGRFLNEQNRFAFSPLLSGLDLTNQLTRSQRGAATVVHQRGADDFSFGIYAARQKDIGDADENDRRYAVDDETSWGASAGWGHRLSRQTRLSTRLSFIYTDASDDEEDTVVRRYQRTGTFRTFLVGGDLTHDLTDTLSAFAGYWFQRRFASDSEDEFTENAVVVGLTRRF